MSNKEILIGVKIQVNNEKAIRKIVESQKQIDELKKKQTELTEAFKEGAISEEEYRKGMEEYRTQIEQSAFKVRALRKEIQNNLRIEEEQKGSLKQLRAALSKSGRYFPDNIEYRFASAYKLLLYLLRV